MTTIDEVRVGNPNASKRKPAMIYGIALSLIGAAFMLIGYFTGWQMTNITYKIVSWIISIGGVFYIVMHFRDNYNNGYLTIGQGVGLSALSGLIAGILSAIFFYIFIVYINTEFITAIENQALQDMADKNMTEKQINDAMEMAKMFMGPGFMCTMAVVGSVISYTIIGLISSAILKRD